MHLEEQSLDASKKRGGKLEEKVETKRNGQKDFVVGDIVLVNWFGYAEWPAVVKKLLSCFQDSRLLLQFFFK